MNDVFLKERQKALEKFLWRLVAHPFFSFDQDIKIFLTASDEVERQGSRKRGVERGGKGSGGIGRKEGGWVGEGKRRVEGKEKSGWVEMEKLDNWLALLSAEMLTPYCI